MPDTEEVKKTVDLDTSGPAMDVDIPESKDETEIVEKETVQEEPVLDLWKMKKFQRIRHLKMKEKLS